MEQKKHFKNEGMSRLLSMEGGFKPSAQYVMNYSLLDQIQYL